MCLQVEECKTDYIKQRELTEEQLFYIQNTASQEVQGELLTVTTTATAGTSGESDNEMTGPTTTDLTQGAEGIYLETVTPEETAEAHYRLIDLENKATDLSENHRFADTEKNTI